MKIPYSLSLTLLISTATLPAATVGMWQFENDFTARQGGSGLDGTGSAHIGGAAPGFSTESPGMIITDGLGGSVLSSTNSSSASFTNNNLPDGQDGSKVTINVSDPSTTLSSFTIEGFVKTDNTARYGTFFSFNRSDRGGSTWMLDSLEDDRLRARFDTQPTGAPNIDNGDGTFSPPAGFNQGFTTSAVFNDGNWHHIALSYDGTTRAVDIYMDYQRVGGGTATFDLVYETQNLVFGASGGGRAFNGLMDEIRLSDSVLTTDQFLRAIPEPGTALLALLGSLGLLRRRR